ncbi:VanZ family protein [Amycolatopsis sp. CA-230715]|uniref:VanZ family protein n=1 Tax=Amycolatopsis sp. CA-230715 TaxID=2745196 RepID=UPI001C01B0EF|nr:VanZ family protein [Amycolatopsis sp. CA-230715]QWF83727.1 hypothetical protein HUW46_07170 [Amycolatopsis sp. CA-230715]
MAQLLRTFGELITLATLGVPPAVLFCGLLAMRRKRSGQRDPGATAVCDVLLVFSACCVLYLVGKPIPGQASTADLTPGTEIADALDELPSSSDPLWQAAANLLLLLPLGALMPVRSARLRSVGRIAGGAVVLSSAIEAAQYLFLTGRVAATDDVVLNTLGATLGALLTRRWWARRRRELVLCDIIPAPIRFRTPVPVPPAPATRSGPAWHWHRLRRVARPAGPASAQSAFLTGKVLTGTSRARLPENPFTASDRAQFLPNQRCDSESGESTVDAIDQAHAGLYNP